MDGASSVKSVLASTKDDWWPNEVWWTWSVCSACIDAYWRYVRRLGLKLGRGKRWSLFQNDTYPAGNTVPLRVKGVYQPAWWWEDSISSWDSLHIQHDTQQFVSIFLSRSIQNEPNVNAVLSVLSCVFFPKRNLPWSTCPIKFVCRGRILKWWICTSRSSRDWIRLTTWQR